MLRALFLGLIPVLDWSDFPEAMRRKLVLEMAALPPERLIRAQLNAAPPDDCLIGAKIRERNQRYYNEP